MDILEKNSWRVNSFLALGQWMDKCRYVIYRGYFLIAKKTINCELIVGIHPKHSMWQKTSFQGHP